MRTLSTPTLHRGRRLRGGLASLTLSMLVLATIASPSNAEPAPSALLSQGKPATSSSVENADYTPASAAVDGDDGTRWSSERSDPQWLQVDLGETSTIDRVVLSWETARATAYEIQVSDDASDWSTIYSTDAAPGGVETLDVSGEGRYVRMLGSVRANGYGYSLWEFQVYGTAGSTTPTDPTDPTDPTEPTEPTDPTDPTDPGPVDPGHPNQPGPFTEPSVVEVTGGNGSWGLQVDGRPFTVKGMTWGPSFAAADHYMPGLVKMGANTIRTWGTGADTVELLDSAAEHGIRVMSGFWLLPGGGPGSGGCIDYTTDSSYKETTKADILSWVETYKDHPAVLMWNVGNESLLGLQNCYSGDLLEANRHAYAAYVNDVAQAIHQIDANHPVTSTDAWTGAWEYLKENAPDLDLLAVNAYGDVCNIEQNWIDGGYDKPYIVTEGGAAGEWEVPDDINGIPDEPTDLEKGQAYVKSWRCITEHEGVGLGATFFHYGIEGDFGGVWFNVLPGDNRRLGYYSLAEAWGAPAPANTPPRIASMSIPGSTDIEAGSTFTVTLDVADPDGDPMERFVFLNSKYINNAGGLAAAEFTETSPGTLQVTAPQMLGVWKAYVFVEDGQGNVGVETTSFRVVAPAVDGTNLALGKPATASSFDPWGADYTPGQATDGDPGTRWASAWEPAQWIQVDLGSVQSFDHVQLVWEAAYGKSYEIQTSPDGNTWTTVQSVTGADGGIDSLDVAGSGRYVRVNLTERGTEYGYSLFELGVYQTR